MRHPFLLLVAALLLASSGCAGKAQSSSPPAGGDGGSSLDASAPVDAAADSSVSTFEAGPGTEMVSTGIGPIPVAAGQELTVCITKRLTNPDPLVITNVLIDLAPGSHHLILYTVTDTQENLNPTPCTPFQGLAFGSAHPVAFAGAPHVGWTFPAGVGFEMPAMQMVRIEAHYINATANAIMGQGNVTMQGWIESMAPPWQKADDLFIGTTNISIPPQSSYSTGPLFQAAPAGTHLISITTHQHHLGTRAQVWASAMPGDMSRQIADDTNWASPAWTLLQPQFDIGSTGGVTYQCDWNNTTGQTVTFGESAATNEMCFVGGYYYPSTGFQICLDGICQTR